MSLLTTTAVCIFIGITFYRIPWKDYEIAITNNIAGVSSAIIILLIIGALSGAWMISGVVPTLIYYGMKIIHPDFFLTSTCIICALVSIMTGSSWTTIATIGIALLGIGKAQGFEEVFHLKINALYTKRGKVFDRCTDTTPFIDSLRRSYNRMLDARLA